MYNVATGIFKAKLPESHDIIYAIFTWLGYINSGCNPIIYAFSSRDFRRAFSKILCPSSFLKKNIRSRNRELYNTTTLYTYNGGVYHGGMMGNNNLLSNKLKFANDSNGICILCHVYETYFQKDPKNPNNNHDKSANSTTTNNNNNNNNDCVNNIPKMNSISSTSSSSGLIRHPNNLKMVGNNSYRKNNNNNNLKRHHKQDDERKTKSNEMASLPSSIVSSPNRTYYEESSKYSTDKYQSEDFSSDNAKTKDENKNDYNYNFHNFTQTSEKKNYNIRRSLGNQIVNLVQVRASSSSKDKCQYRIVQLKDPKQSKKSKLFSSSSQSSLSISSQLSISLSKLTATTSYPSSNNKAEKTLIKKVPKLPKSTKLVRRTIDDDDEMELVLNVNKSSTKILPLAYDKNHFKNIQIKQQQQLQVASSKEESSAQRRKSKENGSEKYIELKCKSKNSQYQQTYRIARNIHKRLVNALTRYKENSPNNTKGRSKSIAVGKEYSTTQKYQTALLTETADSKRLEDDYFKRNQLIAPQRNNTGLNMNLEKSKRTTAKEQSTLKPSTSCPTINDEDDYGKEMMDEAIDEYTDAGGGTA